MTDTPLNADCPEDVAALRADIYRLLARLLLAPPDGELLAFLAALEAEDDGSPMADAWQGLAAAAAATDPDTAGRDHFALLVGVIQGEITPYASWYLHGTLMDEPLVALRRDLRRLGIARVDESRDPEDHLGALCEAMALLVERQDPAQAGFFRAHLAPWAERCLVELAGATPRFYAETGRLGACFLAQERLRLEASPPQPGSHAHDNSPNSSHNNSHNDSHNNSYNTPDRPHRGDRHAPLP
jgi:TorA maturation chaperone TorD